MQHGVDVALTGLVARLEDTQRLLMAAVAHQHRPLFVLAGNQGEAGRERDDGQRDDEDDMPEH